MKQLVVVLTLLLVATAAHAQFTEWSEPVNLGPPVNTADTDTCVQISKNRLSLYFASNRAGGLGGLDLYVTRRETVDSPWSEPQRIEKINSTGADQCPALSLDEHRLYFASNRSEGSCGSSDVWVTRRHDRFADFGESGWQEPINLGCELNSAAADYSPNVFEDENGNVIMYLGTMRGGTEDIYMSVMRGDDSFGPAEPVAELTTADFNERGATIRRDGLEVFFDSDRPGGSGGFDVFRATRASTADQWSTPVPVTRLNSSASDGGKMSLSFDGCELYLRSNRIGHLDLYVAKREKLRQ